MYIFNENLKRIYSKSLYGGRVFRFVPGKYYLIRHKTDLYKDYIFKAKRGFDNIKINILGIQYLKDLLYRTNEFQVYYFKDEEFARKCLMLQELSK